MLITSDGGVSAATGLKSWLERELGHVMTFSNVGPLPPGAVFGTGGAGACWEHTW